MLRKINTMEAGYMSLMAVQSGMPLLVVDLKFMPLLRTSAYFYSGIIEEENKGAQHEGYMVSTNGEFSKLVFSMDLTNLENDEECRELEKSEIKEFLGIPELPKPFNELEKIYGWHMNDVMFLINAEGILELLGVRSV